MASTPLVPIVSGFNLTTSFQDLYLVSEDLARIGIDAATFNNYSVNNVTITIRLVQSITGDIFDEIITTEIIRAGKNFLAPGIIGQAIITGGIIQVKVSANDSVNANITATTVKV